MPWTSPRSLTDDQIYALTVYILAGNKLIDAKNRSSTRRRFRKCKCPIATDSSYVSLKARHMTRFHGGIGSSTFPWVLLVPAIAAKCGGGALGGTRTPTMLLTATSRQRVYQFRHERLGGRRDVAPGRINGADVTNRCWADKPRAGVFKPREGANRLSGCPAISATSA
jgi:hypothetical protein